MAAPAYAACTVPAAAALPDGAVAMAEGYAFYSHFTADLQALSAAGGPAAAAQSKGEHPDQIMRWRRQLMNSAARAGRGRGPAPT